MSIDIVETELLQPDPSLPAPAPAAAFSSRAVAAGALAAIAMTLVLFTLGSGLGFAGTSPWGKVGDTAAKLGIAAGIWLIVTQWLSAAVGGYLTGRLRRRWIGTNTHEVFFRDTAHGFLAWALATAIIGAAAAATSVATTGGAAAASAAAAAQDLAYDTDTLYRAPSADEAALGLVKAEAARLLAASSARGADPPADDRAYLIASVTSHAGVAPAEADRRVTLVTKREKDAAAGAKVAADKARQVAATAAIITALSMMIGAFIASAIAVLGGEVRDRHV